MEEYLVDSEDLHQRKNPERKPSEWISCGRTWQDLLHVATEVERVSQRAQFFSTYLTGSTRNMELSSATTVKLRDHLAEKHRLVWMTTVLNTVQERGADNVNIMDVDGDDDVDD
ncbi:hypothetical protein GGX14DRAFT_396994 [Mycena pura]|uniref:Uncharacterized protein n=1 Tax=Mycena pura TaxID=153505 RepID=A0AAD6YD50_9AGAR|nr:hypothetical protein GGX14DRAFT_396994 [Mycena pura]